ncbi:MULTISPECIES: hypothetical protein [unclassified Acinetobacter]|uniref:hypothetical protein n=1 Tax=unclassified Acinetobacter TaxID=196816 RepID=UPI0015D424DE|nr:MULTISPECIES: hypothetical protein [unclassified Acinetobacter]
MMELSTAQWVQIILAVIGLIGVIFGVIFAVNKRSHKIGNITGNGNRIHNGDKIGKK